MSHRQRSPRQLRLAQPRPVRIVMKHAGFLLHFRGTSPSAMRAMVARQLQRRWLPRTAHSCRAQGLRGWRAGVLPLHFGMTNPQL